MRQEIPLSVPYLNNSEIINNLKECVETGWISTGGRFIPEFEQKVAKYVNTPDAVSCQSGTAGLHTALRILGVTNEDEVIVPTLTFIAAVNPVLYLGAHPVFMDCDSYFCMDAKKLEKFCKEECKVLEKNKKVLINKKSGRRISAIVVVHVFGNAANMEAIMEIAREYDLKVLEDATEAFGSYYTEGRYKGKSVGTIGDMGVYSFNANKIMTTGGGGIIVSQNQQYLDAARYLTTTAKESLLEDALHFVHNEIGYNYRMLNIQAAIGVSQIKEIEKFIQLKERHFKCYQKNLKDIHGLRILPFSPGVRTNYWFYAVYIDAEEFGETRDELMHRLIENKIQCRPVWKLTHTQVPYQSEQNYEIERAYDYERNVLNIPCSVSLTSEEIEIVCEEILRKK